MPQEGTLKVDLIGAKGPGIADFSKDRNLYVKLGYLTQTNQSNVVSAKGSGPKWNETHDFEWSGPVQDLEVKIFGDAAGTDDDFIGAAYVPLDALLNGRSIPAAAYEVWKDEEHRGEIELGLTLVPGGLQGAVPFPPLQFWTYAYVTSLAWSSFKMFKACMVVGDIPVRGLVFLAFVFMELLVFLAIVQAFPFGRR